MSTSVIPFYEQKTVNESLLYSWYALITASRPGQCRRIFLNEPILSFSRLVFKIPVSDHVDWLSTACINSTPLKYTIPVDICVWFYAEGDAVKHTGQGTGDIAKNPLQL